MQKTLYVCDLDNTLLDDITVWSKEYNLPKSSFTTPDLVITREPDLIWWNNNGHDLGLRIDKMYTEIELNNSVLDLIKDQDVVFISRSDCDTARQYKEQIILNLLSTNHVTPYVDNLIHTDSGDETHINIITQAKNEGYDVILIDDNMSRFELAKKLEVDYIIVNQPWNKTAQDEGVTVVQPNK